MAVAIECAFRRAVSSVLGCDRNENSRHCLSGRGEKEEAMNVALNRTFDNRNFAKFCAAKT
jgi:hypothetical protein